ncbi:MULTISPECIES: glycosyltransferase family 2 protein [unclassified Olleya]|jgi:GT2 family glycosyltransferase|uniref:glycosyltransferase family 2 protein n=1 Tax=unclassified Olleya TaxID=2615019 RepID=UPI00119ED390|nr:glycosyltransferase family 2 protein [Olleya sp. Hel_I_94]TVZ49671.1 GT2 family glycosyltransferase [Olleya sp. Hel_I_94]
MQISFLIVTKNRPEDLVLTLKKLKFLMDFSIHEVLVFIDGCSKTETITNDFDWVNWTVSKKSISASPARHILYKKAQGDLFVGLDDDAHPLSQNFISTIQARFSTNKNIGIIAFQEVRGVFISDEEALQQSKSIESYYTNDFIGCGFAIKKEVYTATNGFPVWIDIYGEEPALALEVLDLGYQIIYDPRIIVNHRIDIEKRKLQGRNYFRFERQLNNAIRYYLVYYPKPIKKVLKTLLHNFKKYALTDIRYFKSFITVVFKVIINLFKILKFRQPVKQETIEKKQRLKGLNY